MYYYNTIISFCCADCGCDKKSGKPGGCRVHKFEDSEKVAANRGAYIPILTFRAFSGPF
jgi:hypothetical protein